MKKIFTLTMLSKFGILYSCFQLIILCSFAQAVGDYGSTGSMNWNGGTWNVCVTPGTWAGATTTTTPPVAADNVWILSGHTVTLATIAGNCADLNKAGNLVTNSNLTCTGSITGTGNHSGIGKIIMTSDGAIIDNSPLFNLDINCGPGNTITTGATTFHIDGTINVVSGVFSLGGSIYSDAASVNIAANAAFNTVGGVSYIFYATGTTCTITNNGTLGEYIYSAANLGMRLMTRGATSLLITGSGTANLCTVQSDQFTGATSITIDQDMTLSSNGSSPLSIEPWGSSAPVGAARTLTINAGKTVVIKSGWFHAPPPLSTLLPATNNTYNINGTLDVSTGRIGLVTTSNTNADASGTLNSLTLNIGATGTIRCGSEVNVVRSQPSQTLAINVAVGGTITYSGVSYTTAQGASITNSLLTTNNQHVAFTNVGTVVFTGNFNVARNLVTAGNLTGNVITMNGSVAQTIDAGGKSIDNLVLNNGAGCSLVNSNCTIVSTLTLTNGNLSTGSNTLGISGTTSGAGTIVSGTSGTVLYNGIVAQIIANLAANSVNNLIINNAAGVSLAASTTVNGALTLTNGNILLGANNITVSATGFIIGGSLSSHVITDGAGTFSNAGFLATRTFPVGSSAGSYDPVTISPIATATIAVRVYNTLTPTPTSLPLTNPREWLITPAAVVNANISFSPFVATNLSSPVIGVYSAGAWTSRAAALAGSTFTNSFVFTGATAFATGSKGAFPNTTFVTAATGNWNVATTWVGGVVPAVTDDVEIASGHTITLVSNTLCRSMLVSGTGNALTGAFTLTVSTSLNVSSAAFTTNATTPINVNGSANISGGAVWNCSGTLTVYSLNVAGTYTASSTVTIGTGAIAGSLNIATGGVFNSTNAAAGSVNTIAFWGPLITINGRLGANVSTGGAATAGLRLYCEYNGTTTITGTGVCNIARLQSAVSNLGTNQTIVVDMNMSLLNNATNAIALSLVNGNAGVFTKTLTINAGKTLSITGGANSSIHQAWIDPVAGTITTNAFTGGNITFNINGTLNMGLAQFNLCTTSGGSAAQQIIVNVGSSGLLALGPIIRLYQRQAGQKVYINVADGGIVDASANPLTLTGTAPSTNIGFAATYISWFSLLGNNAVLKLRSAAVTNTMMPFWVGLSNSSYDLAEVTPAATNTIFTCNVHSTLQSSPAPNSLPLTYPREWMITPAVATNADVRLFPNSSVVVPVPTSAEIGMFVNSRWIENVATFNLANYSFAGAGYSLLAATPHFFATGDFPGSVKPFDRGPATTFTTITSGSWSNPAIWDKNLIPDRLDSIVISTGHIVSLTENQQCFHALVKGVLLNNISATVYNLTVNDSLIVSSPAFNSAANVIANGPIRILGTGRWTISGQLTTRGNTIIDGQLRGTTTAGGVVQTWLLQGASPTITVGGILGGAGINVVGEGLRIYLDHTGTALFTGLGIVNLSRIHTNFGNTNNQSTVVDLNINLNNQVSGASVLTLQQGGNGTATKSFTINAGKTVAITNAVGGTFHHYTSVTPGVVGTGGSMTYNVNGTLDISAGQFNLFNNTVTATNSVTVNVGAAGNLILPAATKLYTHIPGQSAVILPVAGSTITFKGTSPATIVTQTGTGTVPVFPSTVYNLVINNSGGVTLPASIAVNELLTLTAGELKINGNTLSVNGTIAPAGTGTITGSATSNLTIGGTNGSAGILNMTTGFRLLNNFTVNRTGLTPSVTMGTDVAVNGIVTMTSGEVVMNGRTFTLNGLIAAAGAGTFTGSITSNFVVGGTTGGSAGIINMTTGAELLNNFTINRTGALSSATLGTGLQSNGVATFTAGALLLNGNTLRLRDASWVSGSITGSASSNLTIDGIGGSLRFTGGQTILRNLRLNAGATVSLGDNLDITAGAAAGSVTVLSGAVLNTVGRLTLKSDANGTARVSEIPVNGVGVALGTISGTVTVERFLPMSTSSNSRRWRLLTAPITGAGNPTISSTWQEGAVPTSSVSNITAATNPYPGFGTHITFGIGAANNANGFDAGSTASSSIYYMSGGNWVTPSRTNGNTATTGLISPLNGQQGYMVFVRGDRGITISNQYINTSGGNTLRAKGQLITGDVTVPITGGKQVIANPYASAISFNNISYKGIAPGTQTGVSFYLWDPKLAGSKNVGGFATFSSNGDNTYTIVPYTGSSTGMSAYSNAGIIQSGEAFMIDTSAGGNIVIHESDKLSSSSSVGIASRPGSGNNSFGKIYSNLLVQQASADFVLTDGVATFFGEQFNLAVDHQDAGKMMTFTSKEKISLLRGAKLLAVERRGVVTIRDSVFYALAIEGNHTYRLQLTVENFNPLLQPYVLDNYLQTATAIQGNGTDHYQFETNNDPKSFAPDRLTLVFKFTATPLPVHFTNVRAVQQPVRNVVEFTTEQEDGVAYYEVEKSFNGIQFFRIGLINALNGNGATYQLNDENPTKGLQYYRVKSVDVDGKYGYSEVVKLQIGSTKNVVTLQSNPAQGNNVVILLKEVDKGLYNINLFNTAGQLVYTSSITHNGGNAFIKLPIKAAVAGLYELKVNGRSIDFSTKLILN